MRTFKLACPKCGADETHEIMLNLNAMDEVTCSGCSETFTAQEARDHFRDQLRRWDAVVRWIENAPAIVLE